MRLPRVQFTVRGMMAAVAAVALTIAILAYPLPEPTAAMRAAAGSRAVASHGWYLAPGTGQLRFSRYRPAFAARRSPTHWEVRLERVSGDGPPGIVTAVPQWEVDAARVWWRPMRFASPPARRRASKSGGPR